MYDDNIKESINLNSSDPYGTKQIQSYYLPMMNDFHEFCVRNGIQYSLSGGTLLGAVRHGGFIPWDDDMDVMFDRKNYEKFIFTFSKDPIADYEIVGSTWVKRLTKADNPLKNKEEQCIDLFVFDPVPKGKVASKLKVFILKILQGMMKDKPQYERFPLHYKILLFATWLLGRLFSQKRKYIMYNKVSQFGKAGEKINAYNTWFDQIGRLEFDKNIFDEYTFLPFEGRVYMAISRYHSYLKELYGDYMKIPPLENRKPSHKK